jgi:very-short-patch-repair endonuclease
VGGAAREAGVHGTIEERIAAVAARQHGVVTWRQLTACGLAPRTVSRWCRSKRLHELHRGVYRVGLLPLPREREMAAVLACGEGAAISHEDAAGLWELRAPPMPHCPVHVRVPDQLRIRRPGLRVHRTKRFDAGDVALVDGIPVTSPARTILDLAAVLSVREVERLLARAQRERIAALDDVAALLARHRGARGGATLARLLASPWSTAFTRSEFEDRFRDESRRFGLPPPRFNHMVGGYEVDCYWPEARLALELDGEAYHGSWRNQERDRLRDATLAATGIHVIRVSWRQFTEKTEQTMVRVAQTLAIARDRAAAARGW